ncbi:Nif3-like dinuclear metal center hexameric protein [Fangia hongkongensis]|uniref:Nif3-like dinuclear metal center hexameric protein n=1 Tax=Fangia hongkongensis TaxID=270495 RepID=UPI0003727152
MMKRNELQNYLTALLDPDAIKDYCPNGLQIEGKNDIEHIVTGVTANQKLINAAIERKANAILVHHGYFWKSEPYPIVGMRYQRISRLIKHDINLFAYHLPLDIHPTLGNNVMLAKLLGLKVLSEFNTNTSPNYGILCQPQSSLSIDQLQAHIQSALKRTPLVINPTNKPISKIAICTGGAQDFIEHAYEAGAEVYISGEASERTTHFAEELGISYIAAGHHASERYGIQALGEHLAQHFNLQHTFIDIDNPV